MRARPPTLRDKKRYVLAAIEPCYTEIDPRQMYYALFDVVSSLFGDVGAGRIKMTVISCDKGYVIARCIRGTEAQVETAMAALTSVDEHHIALRTLATSGTLHGLKGCIRTLPTLAEGGVCMIEGQDYTAFHLPLEKVDLFMGNKDQERLYFTEDDLEEF